MDQTLRDLADHGWLDEQIEHLRGCATRLFGTNVGRRGREVLGPDEVFWIVAAAVRESGDHWLTRAIDRTSDALDHHFAGRRAETRYALKKYGRGEPEEPATVDKVIAREQMPARIAGKWPQM